MEEAVAEVESLTDPTLAAKRLQDLAHGYGCEENLSVMVLRFELDERINCSSNEHLYDKYECAHDDHQHHQNHNYNYDYKQYRDPATNFVPLLMDEERCVECTNESASAVTTLEMSEKNFRCWEYMLEQNMKMLFDKELNTLSKNFTKRRSIPPRPQLWSSTLWPAAAAAEIETPLPCNSEKEKSASHLPDCVQNTPCLFKNLVGCGGGNDTDSVMVAGTLNNASSLKNMNSSWTSCKSRTAHCSKWLNGGPNAAYFGSLQRLMPYHVDYNYSEMVEKRDYALDSLEEDVGCGSGNGRMRKYWDVTTTEL